MAAYILFIREGDVLDAAGREHYIKQARAVTKGFGKKALAKYGHMETLEGEAPGGVVLLEFPTSEAAWHPPNISARRRRSSAVCCWAGCELLNRRGVTASTHSTDSVSEDLQWSRRV